MNHKEFLRKDKGMLIAPAGHGKTHTIVDCLIHSNGIQLVLTHTHAGVAALKEKINKANIPSSKFHIETISSYAQKYVLAYTKNEDIPSQENSSEYYPFLIKQATKIFASNFIKKSIATSYNGLFVDEYQDCTISQHELVTQLAEILPTRILGDPLQGIFEFRESLVDLNNVAHIGDFISNKQILTEPWRWKGQNELLGAALVAIRNKIQNKEQINLQDYPTIRFIKVDSEAGLYVPTDSYYKKVNEKLTAKEILLIHPDSTSINQRKRVISVYAKPIKLLESIDDKAFYELAKLFDAITPSNIFSIFNKICQELFNKTELAKWLTEKKVVSKNATKIEEKKISVELASIFETAKVELSPSSYLRILRFILKIEGIKCYRKELLSSLCSSLISASKEKTIYEAMTETRNHARRTGRKIHGRCIGTTLLTKGLEFENVIILNVNRFKDPRHLYVALTRASKNLTVFGLSPLINLDY